MMRRWKLVIARSAGQILPIELLSGAAAAVCLSTLCLQLALLWGTSPGVSLALCAALGLGLAAGCRTSRTRIFISDRVFTAVCRFGIAAWVVASPWTLAAIEFVVSKRAFFQPETPGRNSVVVFLAALCIVGAPAFLAAQLAGSSSRSDPTRSAIWMLWGAVCGLTIWALGTAQVAGPYLCSVIAALVMVIPAIWQLWRGASDQEESIERVDAPANLPAWRALVGFGLECGLAAACGGMLVGMTRVLEQLLVGSVYLVVFECAAVMAGLATGLALAPTLFCRTGSAGRLWTCLAAALFSVGVLGAFPWLVHCVLWMNATIASSTLLILSRGALSLLLIGVPAVAIGVCLRRTDSAESTVAGPRTWILCGIVAWCFVSPSAARGISTDLVVIGCAWCLAILGGIRWLPTAAVRRSRITRFAAIAVTLMLLAAPLCRGRFTPALSAKVLFSTGSFAAYRAGMKVSQLPWLDEARLIGSVAGARGTTTVWKYGANQLQLRENGIPGGLVSCDSGVFPRSLAESLPAILPLVLHERPRSALFLGVGSGETLSVGLSFPVPEFVCWEADPARVSAIRDIVSREIGADPLKDDRVQLVVCDPALALDAEQGLFDVIVSSPGHPGLLRAQPSFTREFYARAARRLSPRGIFCQRLQTIDLGPRPIAAIVHTLQSVFHDVLVIESGPGEMLLAAADETQCLIRPGLVERLQRPQVRDLLSQSGLDWTLALNLAAWQDETLRKFCGTIVRSNQAVDARLAFAMPREVMRWGNKSSEVAAALAPSAGRLAKWIGKDGESPVLVRRLAEVAGQQELMAKFNDQYWAYRTSLRTQLTEKPRSKIELVAASTERKTMHPEDRRRLFYFEALGRATQTRAPLDIERMLTFAFPYDPLLSYFVRFEAAELYAHSSDPDAQAELRNRLYVTWYSSPRDASLRNVLATLKLLRDHPEAEPEPVRRWDQFNAALQALQQRWEARGGTRPRDVQETVAEIDATVIATEEAFAAMQDLTREAGIPAADWAARRAVLERNLIRPVKSYRSELLPHLHRQKKKPLLDQSTIREESDAAGSTEPPADEEPRKLQPYVE